MQHHVHMNESSAPLDTLSTKNDLFFHTEREKYLLIVSFWICDSC